ncbi:MAG TPA: phosphate ABC transporter substrate-binding protein PstS [Dehalococcoidia bacterium]|nr:phosphate ABC transporter substrate-binding protein PstS [Dehalococcoidia bacterium]
MIRHDRRAGRLLGLGLALLAGGALLLAACSSGTSNADKTATAAAAQPAATSPGGAASSPTAASGGIPANVGKNDKAQITGAGSSALTPFITTIADLYHKNVATGVTLNYGSIGSGGGISQFTAKTVDFGASDIYLNDEQIQKAGGAVLNIPVIHWAVAITYNIPGFRAEMKLSPDTIAGIYLGTIKKWNDPAIKADNPGVSLPDLGITPVHRSDGSGTTMNFTSFLAAVNSNWQSKVGAGLSVNWPGGVGGKGSEGVTAAVKTAPGTIGYVELSYALQNNLPVASVKNAAGSFVKPTLESTTAAVAAQVPNAPADLRFLIVNPPASAANAYPIGASTWVLLYKDYPSSKSTEVKAMVDFLWWAIHDGQSYAAQVDYSAMAPNLVQKAEQALKSITVGGTPVLGG